MNGKVILESMVDLEPNVKKNTITVINGKWAVESAGYISGNEVMPSQVVENYSLLSTSGGYESLMSDSVLWRKIARMQDDMQQKFDEDRAAATFVTNMATGTGISLAAGVLAWVTRTGAFLTSLLSILPAWKGVDPLAILNNIEKKDIKKKSTDGGKDSKSASTESVDDLFNQSNKVRRLN